MIAQDFFTFLSGQVSTQIYPQFLPQNHQGFPAITFSVDDDRDDQLIDGVGSMRTALVSVDCWDLDYLSVHTLADSVSSALVGHVGTFAGSEVSHIRKERQLDLYEQDTGLFRVSLQYLIAYN